MFLLKARQSGAESDWLLRVHQTAGPPVWKLLRERDGQERNLGLLHTKLDSLSDHILISGMWGSIFKRLLEGLFQLGSLTVETPDDARNSYGDGTGPELVVRISDPDLIRRIVLSPELAVGEGYMDGTLSIEGDQLREFLALAMQNIYRDQGGSNAWIQTVDASRSVLRRWRAFNPISRSRKNVAHHYDLSGDLYELFLDDDKQYSCAYFSEPGMSLDDAQAAKKRHIAKKLLLEPDMTVLDIGCGWGGLGLTLARDFGARVLGVTLSEEQLAVATARASAEGLEDRIEFRLMDYRAVTGQFDRVVSVGMFEHVGLPHYNEYFRQVRDRLTPDGIALIHTIGRSLPPGVTSPWIEKYIFPGGYIPSLSEMVAASENAGLWYTDLEIWRIHYAETLRHWFERFTANRDRVLEIYDERFFKMWKFYLAASEMAFLHGRQAVFQMQLANDQTAVPMTRDYLCS